jgi:hypothetical protein
MLDPRLYRAGFVPVLLALVVAAFSLVDLPRPMQTTLAPDQFVGRQALARLDDLASRFPKRRPGDAADAAMAQEIATTFRESGFRVSMVRHSGATIDGTRSLVDVVATRAGRPGPGLVLVAHRDAAGAGARAELSGTAALLEIAALLQQGGRTNRTLTVVSTSGGSGGAAGVRAVIERLPRPIDAAIVLGNLASRQVRRPFVVPWTSGGGLAPIKLRRTVEGAVRKEAAMSPGSYRATAQLARLAVPFATGEQGPLDAAGIPAVTLSATGERVPAPDAAVSQQRLQAFGRAALRSLTALDNGPDLRTGPNADVQTLRKVLPGWAVRLLGGALLIPALLAAIDGFARVRRRREPVEAWLRWIAVLALPFLGAAVLVWLMDLSGLLGASPPSLPPAGAMPVDGTARGALSAVGLVLLLGWLVLRPVKRALGVPPRGGPPGSAAAVLLVLVVAATAVWVVNPFAGALFVPAAHLWLIAVAPDFRLRRSVGTALVVLGLAPFALVAINAANSLGIGPVATLWEGLLAVAGGEVGPLGVLAGCVVAACAVGALDVVWSRPALEPPEPDITVRGPVSYAGPGSLGGTASALPRR